MTVTATRLTPHFAARIEGADVTRPLDDAAWNAIRAALDEHSVLVFHGAPLEDETQIAFSRRFGALEVTRSMNPAAGTPFARQSNLDIRTGEVIPPDDRRMFYQKANMLWHADSTFKAVSSLASVLSARVVPEEGGATEFASTRAAYDSLSAAQKAEVEDLIVEHDFGHSRGLVGFKFTPEEAEKFPPVRHRLVRVNPNNGRKSVMIGVHAKCIVGWPEAKSRALLDDLLARATRPENTYRHAWKLGDVILWSNQAVVHRATPFDSVRYKRLMQRTTISFGSMEEMQRRNITDAVA
ncbi:MAG TPA: TauD/TfdA family dioxygenase [Pseudomonadales bacterium]|nr:TauD/TfdA family dioxygenase [Pseudomonadales bacterium]